MGGFARPVFNRQGLFVFFMNDRSNVCAGEIGNSGNKTCVKTTCSIASHKKTRDSVLEEGLYAYVNGSTTEVYDSPMVPASMLNEEVLESMLSKSFSDVAEVFKYFNLINEAEDPLVLSMEDLEDLDIDIQQSLKTPAKRFKSNINNHYNEFINTLEQSKVDSAADEGLPSVLADEVGMLLKKLVAAVAEDQDGIKVLSDKLSHIINQVGSRPLMGLSTPPSLWLAYQHLLEEIKKLKEKPSFTHSSDVHATTEAVTHIERRLDNDIEGLQHNTSLAFDRVEKNLDIIKGPSFDPFITRNLSQLTEMLDFTQQKVEDLTKSIDTINAANTSPAFQVIRIGRFTFKDQHELHAWCTTHLPSRFPFGAFIDVYSFLERVVSFRDAAPTTELKQMEVRKKLNLSSDDALVIESFKHPLPKIFSGGASETSMSKSSSWLPGISSVEKWECKYGLAGAKVTIKDNLEVIRNRLESIIATRLATHTEAQSLARQLLSDTIAFISSLSRFISETYTRLELAGFGSDGAWNLVSKLVHRFFATDCSLKRGPVLEVLNAENAEVMAVGALWGTFSTHQVMREYTRHGIENHPSIASEYVRFLVANCGLNRVASLEKRLISMEKEVKDLRSATAEVKKAATTAANKADEAKKLAAKK